MILRALYDYPYDIAEERMLETPNLGAICENSMFSKENHHFDHYLQFLQPFCWAAST